MRRIDTTAHDNGDLSVRLQPHMIDAMKSLFNFIDVRASAEKQEADKFVSSFDQVALRQVYDALERPGRQATPEEQGIDWRDQKMVA